MKERIAYLDCLRGIAMLMVIYCHVQKMCFGYNGGELLGGLLSICMLPLFFFISSFITPLHFSSTFILKRFRYMVLPTIFMFLLLVGASFGNYRQLMYCLEGEYKWGYWFTIALFEMNLLHFCIQLFVKNRIYLICVLSIIAILLILAKDWDWNHNQAFFSRWLCLRLLSQHFPFYIMGLCCMIFKERFHQIVSNDYFIGGTLVLFTALFNYPHGGFYKALLLGTLGMTMVYRFFLRYQSFFSDATFIGRQLTMIGRNTLPIYLLHYFIFLHLRMPWMSQLFSTKDQGWLIAFSDSVVTLFIAYISIAICKFIGMSVPLYRLMFGK